jgi:predicted RNase H-like HicB family nuclease
MPEIIFLVQEDPEEGWTAQALQYNIFTQADTLAQLKDAIKEAIHCHFAPLEMPNIVRLHQVKEEVFAL